MTECIALPAQLPSLFVPTVGIFQLSTGCGVKVDPLAGRTLAAVQLCHSGVNTAVMARAGRKDISVSFQTISSVYKLDLNRF